nr:u4/u6 small nuclear ribonucleoprotein prp4-like protein [Quercus suber]
MHHLSQAQHSTTPRLSIFILTVPQAAQFHQQSKESFIMKLCVKALGVPTITYDMAVQTRPLCKLGEPIILFGEKEMERVDIAKYSLLQAASCITLAQRKRDDLNEDMDADAELDWGLKQEVIFIGDHRPLFGCSISRHGKLLLATSSLSGITKLWSIIKLKWFLHQRDTELEMISAFNAYEVLVHIELLTMSHLYWGSCARNLVRDLAK